MRKNDENVMESNTLPNASEISAMKEMMTELTLNVTPKVLVELGFPYEQWDEDELNSLMDSVGKHTEKTFDAFTELVEKCGFELYSASCFAVPIYVALKTASLLVELQNYTIGYIAYIITSAIVQYINLSDEEVEVLLKFCGAIIKVWMKDSANQTEDSK